MAGIDGARSLLPPLSTSSNHSNGSVGEAAHNASRTPGDLLQSPTYNGTGARQDPAALLAAQTHLGVSPQESHQKSPLDAARKLLCMSSAPTTEPNEHHPATYSNLWALLQEAKDQDPDQAKSPDQDQKQATSKKKSSPGNKKRTIKAHEPEKSKYLFTAFTALALFAAAFGGGPAATIIIFSIMDLGMAKTIDTLIDFKLENMPKGHTDGIGSPTRERPTPQECAEQLRKKLQKTAEENDQKFTGMGTLPELTELFHAATSTT